jgi:hypothetical protein
VRFASWSVEEELTAVGRDTVVETEEMADDSVLDLEEAIVLMAFGSMGARR